MATYSGQIGGDGDLPGDDDDDDDDDRRLIMNGPLSIELGKKTCGRLADGSYSCSSPCPGPGSLSASQVVLDGQVPAA